MDLAGITIHDRFKLIKKTAEGVTGSLYLAHRVEKKTDPVVIKIFNDDVISKKTEDRIRFRYELGILSTTDHANLVKFYDYGEIFELLYIAFEHVPGTSLSEILKKSDFSVDQIIDIIIQTAQALDHIHQHGIIQRDLSPENLIIHKKDESAGLIVKLTDSGAAHVIDFNELMAKSEDIPDLFKYFSPEQSGLKKRHVDERSDLYSLGVIFYQLLTLQLPFTPDDSFLFVRRHTEKEPELPSRLNPSAPSILDRIVLKLLELEPENRYQSAKGLLYDLYRFKNGDREFIVGLNDASIKLSFRTKLIGRMNELHQLKMMFDRAREGTGCVCVIGGEAGIGKTRLIEELHYYIYSQNVIVLQGKCFYGNNKEPYGFLKEALDGYLRIFSCYSDEKKKQIREKIRIAAGMLGGIIIKINPQMKEILGECPSLVTLNPKAENQRFLLIINQFFQNLSAIENGLVFIIEDLQWSSDLTLELLNVITDNVSESSLLVIGTYRHNEITDEHALMKFIKNAKNKGSSFIEIIIQHFDSFSTNNFISNLLCESEIKVKEISDFIHQKSKGNPLFAIEILKQLVNEKALYYKHNKWDIDNDILHQSVIPATIIDILIKRISFLNKNEATVLSYAAVIGKSFEIELLFRLLSEFNKTDLVRIIDDCVQLQLIDKDIHRKDRLAFVHDRVQEAFYINIDADTRKKMHARVAETIEEIYVNNTSEVLFELAHHYIESGNRDKSFEYAYPASFKAAENFSHKVALRYFNITVDLLTQKIESGDDGVRMLWMTAKNRMARVYLIIGRYDDAIDIFNQLLPFEHDDISKALVLNNISTAYYKKGDWVHCEEYAKIGIKLLGGKLPVKRRSVVFSLMKELLVHGLHVVLPKIYITQSPNPKAGKKIVEGIFYEALINSYVLSGRLKYARAVLKILNHVEAYLGGGQPFAKALYAYGTLLMSFTRFKDALRYYYKSLEISKGINDQFNIGRCYQLIGYCYDWAGEYDKAIENYNFAIDVFHKIGDSNGIGFTLNGLCNSYLQNADFDNLKTTNDRFFEIANKSNDNYQMCNALIFRTLYYFEIGKYNIAEAYALQARNLSLENKIWMPYCIINILLGSIYKLTSDTEKSIKHIEEAKILYEKHKFLKYYTIFLYPIIVDIYINDYLLKNEISNEDKKAYIKKIKKSCKLALSKTRKWAMYYNQSLMVNAKYYALIKKNKKAEKFFLRAIAHFSKFGMKLEFAKSLFKYGQFLSEIGDTEASRKNFELAYQIFGKIGNHSYSERLREILGITGETLDTASMQQFVHNKRLLSIDRLSTKINQISDFDELFNTIVSNAVEITCAQNGYLFIASDNDELDLMATTSIADSHESAYFPEIVENVYKNSNEINTISLVEDIENIDGQSVKSSSLKSILCIPIKMKESVIGVCYLDNTLSNGQFSEEDVNLLTAFITKVSSSINYAYLYRQSNNKNNEQWIITPSIENKMIQAITYVKQNYRFNIAREGLANMLDINSDNLGRYFRMYTGEKIGDYINRLRVEEAAKKLRETDENVINIAFSVGFENISTFNKVFIKFIKTTPTNYRKIASDTSST